METIQVTQKTEEQKRMARAWTLVDPQQVAIRLFHEGKVSKADMERATWRDPIRCCVTERDLREAAVTIEDVAAAIVFYTATEATMSEWMHSTKGQPDQKLWHVDAVGYRMGPAGP